MYLWYGTLKPQGTKSKVTLQTNDISNSSHQKQSWNSKETFHVLMTKLDYSIGVPQIEVTFEIDANGILQVSAEDKGTGNKEKITITNDQNRLTPEDIEQMIKDAETFADEDSKLKSRVESRNELESYAYSLKNQINDKEKLGAKISEEDKEKIEEAVNEKISWWEENQEADGEDFKKQKKELEDAVQPIIAKLYQQGGGPPPGAGEGEEEDEADKDEL